ncbi:hypothetical protein [Streptomyces chattanoogensis]|uniref:hypothetical protein n=1 Tax=Streptomyces chattanoogensis TaxID=66876 RepID=UPI0006B5AD17|nr:hypothetical protein [Streptomyces chattanoogensis]
MTTGSPVQDTVRTYYDARFSGDVTTAAALIGEDFAFRSPFITSDSPDGHLDGLEGGLGLGIITDVAGDHLGAEVCRSAGWAASGRVLLSRLGPVSADQIEPASPVLRKSVLSEGDFGRAGAGVDRALPAANEDQHTVIRGIVTPCNSGDNEGRITDAKLQKRLMAGRASVPLLHPPSSPDRPLTPLR